MRKNMPHFCRGKMPIDDDTRHSAHTPKKERLRAQMEPIRNDAVINPDESYITIATLTFTVAINANEQPSHQFEFAIKVPSITMQITWKIPLVDLHTLYRARRHTIRASKRLRYVDSS